MKKIIFTVAVILGAASLALVSCKKDKKTDPSPSSNNTSLSPGQFKDSRDGQIYDSVRIGTQTWMKENVNYDVSGSKCPSGSTDSCKKYGKLYNYTQATNVCPAGWHLPSDSEWMTLENHYGMTQHEDSIFSSGSSDRGTRRDSLLDISGFDAVYTGWYVNSSTYTYNGASTGFWATNQIYRMVDKYGYSIQRYDNTGDGDMWISVRCIKD